MIFISDSEDRATHIQQLIASTWKFPNSRLTGVPWAHIDTFSHLGRWDWKNIYEVLGTGNLPCHPTSTLQTSHESRNRVPGGCCPDHTHSRVHQQGRPCQLKTFWLFGGTCPRGWRLLLVRLGWWLSCYLASAWTGWVGWKREVIGNDCIPLRSPNAFAYGLLNRSLGFSHKKGRFELQSLIMNRNSHRVAL
jgi:hypothetical protein